MANYTYTIFDAKPNTSSGTAWPSHQDIELEADSDEEAIEAVGDVMSVEAGGLNVADGYDVGQRLYALIRDANTETTLDTITYELTAGDLGASKDGVAEGEWSSVASFVSTFPSDDGEGACDVDVQVGGFAGVWFLRTRDDAGGSDDADDTAYATKAEAEAAAEVLADARNKAGAGEDADDYLARKTAERAGEPDAEGEWCVYWETSLDDSSPCDRYATEEQATAAAELKQAKLVAKNPGQLLCGFGVRHLVDGEWAQLRDE